MYKNKEIEQSISSKTLYSYLDKSNKEKDIGLKNYCKRQKWRFIFHKDQSL